jgi:hypothetical protein
MSTSVPFDPRRARRSESTAVGRSGRRRPAARAARQYRRRRLLPRATPRRCGRAAERPAPQAHERPPRLGSRVRHPWNAKRRATARGAGAGATAPHDPPGDLIDAAMCSKHDPHRDDPTTILEEPEPRAQEELAARRAAHAVHGNHDSGGKIIGQPRPQATREG